MPDKKIKIVENGPYKVSGNVPLQKEIIIPGGEGFSEKWGKGEKYPDKVEYNLCRCGKSSSMPYCDGTHTNAGTDCTETANNEPYDQKAVVLEGPGADMQDCRELCATARFCDRGDTAWNLVNESDDPEAKKMLIEECCDCPSGRLVVRDKKTGEIIEPKLDKSIGIVEDPALDVSGPLWIKGGIPIESASGEEYEIRNRVTLCRCGKSRNKPFCDASHIEAEFNDGDKSINNHK